MGNKLQTRWRPDDWPKIRADKVGCEEDDTEETLFYQAKWDFLTFEDGADAALEALRQRGTRVDETATVTTISVPHLKELHGILIFIPDGDD